jgi:DNA-binding SARP family transcriptional activator
VRCERRRSVPATDRRLSAESGYSGQVRRPFSDMRARPARGDDEQPEVVVRVLGPVEVVGHQHGFQRAWSLELVVYLAVQARVVANDVWATALWPERVPAAATLHSTASAARRALGRSAAGLDHLPRRHGSLRLAPTVGTDWQTFSGLAASTDPAAWDCALDLVRGRPFDGLRGGDWVVLEGFAAQVEEGVTSCALGVAQRALATGDPAAAARAARRGLAASPFDERLFRVLLRAADLAGNPGQVEAVMDQLLRVLSPEPGSGHLGFGQVESVVHPETAAVYRAVSRRSRSGAVLSRL